MNEKTTMGIGDMAIYAPSPSMDLETLLRGRSESHPDLAKRLRRAVENTGQLGFRFPEPWEDTVSMAANAAATLLDRCPEDYGDFRYVFVGSETGVDHAKPMASYVQGILRRGGYELSRTMTTLEVKHACAGGTAALISTAALLGYSGRRREKALAVCSDISRYDAPSTAEITQGAGAVAMIVESNPRLLEIDMEGHGYYASDVDDFFRPLNSVTAKVKGRYSMECYQEALSEAFRDCCARRGCTPSELIDEVDYLAFHVPFVKMAESALRRLLKGVCGKSSEEIDGVITRTGFLDSMGFSRRLGNLYTGAVYAYIMSLLGREYDRIGEDIVGRKILIASYGSGNTMIVLTASVAAGAPGVISGWDLDAVDRAARPASFPEYLAWLARPKELDSWRNLLDEKPKEAGKFYLSGFGKTGLRLYERA